MKGCDQLLNLRIILGQSQFFRAISIISSFSHKPLCHNSQFYVLSYTVMLCISFIKLHFILPFISQLKTLRKFRFVVEF